MKFLLKLISYVYRLVITIRHWLFDIDLLKSETFDIPVICVGNITVGGTGKTPAEEMIIDYMRSYYHVALLSRGYGRRTSGYIEVKSNSSYRDVGTSLPCILGQGTPWVCFVITVFISYLLTKLFMNFKFGRLLIG